MRKLLFVITLGVMLCMSASGVFAQTVVDVEAEIPAENSFTVEILKVEGEVHTSDSKINFGQLQLDTENYVFGANCYYKVYPKIDSNAADWTLTQSIQQDVVRVNGTETLNDSIKVTFVECLDQTNEQVLFGTPFSLTKSNNKVIKKSDIASTSWLRIDYGIATTEDATAGTMPITLDKPYGIYKGQIKLTFVAS